ncbi:MAG: hypothetical protein AB7P76_05240 [Candidatus Melainabacteria bacterium]
MAITQDMSVPEIVAGFPATKPVFAEFGIPTQDVKALEYENLFATARVQQVDLQALLKRLNEVAG